MKRKNKLETSKELGSTTRVLVRLWSDHYYHRKYKKANNIYDGMVVDVVTGDIIKFHTAGEMLIAIEKMYAKIEKLRVRVKAPQTTNPKHIK